MPGHVDDGGYFPYPIFPGYLYIPRTFFGTYRKRKIMGNLTDNRRCLREFRLTLTSYPDVHPMMRIPGLAFSTRRRYHACVAQVNSVHGFVEQFERKLARNSDLV